LQAQVDYNILRELRAQYPALDRWWYRPCAYCNRQPHYPRHV
jgi:hypothetical protein